MRELKAYITEQKLKGNSAFGLKLTNVGTGEEYANDDAHVPADANILVKRVPINQISSGSSARAGAVGSISVVVVVVPRRLRQLPSASRPHPLPRVPRAE